MFRGAGLKVLYHHRTRGKGAEGVHILGIVKAMRELGMTVDIMSMPGADPEQTDAATQPRTKTQSGGGGALSKLMGLTRFVPEFAFEMLELLYNAVAYFRIATYLRGNDPQWIYERYSLFMFGGVWLARARGKPIVLEVNDSVLVERVRPLFFKSLARRIERWLFENASGLVFISTHFQQVATRSYPDIAPSVICPNAADIKQFTLDENVRKRMRAELNLNGKLVCGYVGAFVYWHGIDWFVRQVMPELSRAPDLVLLLVGDGVVHQAISDEVAAAGLEDKIILTGRVSHDRVADYVSAMDYGILPDSNQYGSPMKLFEMMSMKVASVCPAFDPVAEVIDDGKTGWLFPPGNRDEAVAKVLELAQDPSHVREVGEGARQYIEAERQWIHNVKATLELIPNA